MAINLTDALNAATTKGKLADAKQIYLEGDNKNLQDAHKDNEDHLNTLDTRSTQIEESLKTIAATGGASNANAVIYDNTTSGLVSVNVNGALDELAIELTEIENNVGLYNVDKNIPLGSGYYTSTTARSAIPTAVRKLGLIITYKTDSTTSVTEQFTGSSISSWTTDTNWTNVGSAGGNKILEWNTDVATTRKQVLQKYRKPGIQISYKPDGGDWVNEQYVGTSFADKDWEDDKNWSLIVDKNILKKNGIDYSENNEEFIIAITDFIGRLISGVNKIDGSFKHFTLHNFLKAYIKEINVDSISVRKTISLENNVPQELFNQLLPIRLQQSDIPITFKFSELIAHLDTLTGLYVENHDINGTCFNIIVNNQNEFENVKENINNALISNYNIINIIIKEGIYYYNDKHFNLSLSSYPNSNNATINIIGEGNVRMIPVGTWFELTSESAIENGKYICNIAPYESNQYAFNELLLDENFNEISLWNDIEYKDIETVNGNDKRVKYEGLPDSIPTNAYVHYPYWFVSGFDKIQKVEGGYVYFTATKNTAEKRIRLININTDSGVVINSDKIYIPIKYRKVFRCNHKITFMYINDAFSNIKITGINFIGGTDSSLISKNYNIASEKNISIEISNNSFSNIKSQCIDLEFADFKNIFLKVTFNKFNNVYRQAINALRIKVLIENNKAINCGKYLKANYNADISPIAFNIKSEGCVRNNILIDCCGDPIMVGCAKKDNLSIDDYHLICEKNLITFTKQFYNKLFNNIISDLGCIYLSGHNTIIRDNIINGIPCLRSKTMNTWNNYGIFGDDGPHNCAIYRNIILNHQMSDYDIHLRDASTTTNTSETANIGNFIGYNFITYKYLFSGRANVIENDCKKGINFIINDISESSYGHLVDSENDYRLYKSEVYDNMYIDKGYESLINNQSLNVNQFVKSLIKYK